MKHSGKKVMSKENVWSAPGRMQKLPQVPSPKPKVGLQSRPSTAYAANDGASELKMQPEGHHEYSKERLRRQQRLSNLCRQKRRSVSNEYLLDKDDSNLYTDRLKYLHGKRHLRAPLLLNYANTDMPDKGQKTIISYDRETQKPTKDLQALVMLMVHEQIQNELARLSKLVGEHNPLDMRNMRLNSFISKTPDLVDFRKVAMLEESKRLIEDSLEQGDLSWASPHESKNREIPMQVDENVLVLVPPDKPEISKSQVAKEYIQAQRGQQEDNEQEDLSLLFENELLMAQNAAAASPVVFDRIINCYQMVAQKLTELEYIENKPETRSAVDNYIEELKSGGCDKVIQSLIRCDLEDYEVQGRLLVRIMVGQVMDELHAYHTERNFKPINLDVSLHT